jgi:regulator of nucleoside diphosphate kinase
MSLQAIVVTDRDFSRLSALVGARAPGSARDHAHIARLEEELARSVPIAAAEVPRDVVTMHSEVRVRDLAAGAARTFTLVFPHEADLASGRLSVLAPLGTAVLGYRAGDEIEWTMPGGVRRLRIEGVSQRRSCTAVTASKPDRATKTGRRLPRRSSPAPLGGAA